MTADNAEQNVAAAMIITHQVLALALMQDKDADEASEAIGAALVVVKQAEDGDVDAVERINVAVTGVNQLIADIANRNAN